MTQSQSRNQSQSQSEYEDSNVVMMFYKKTGISCCVTDEKGFKETVEKWANKNIILDMRLGKKISDIIKQCSEENDKIIEIRERKLVMKNFDELCITLSGAAKALGIKNRNKIDAGRDVMIHWFVNTCMLLKLRAIENNDDNGWLFVKKIGDRAEITTF